MMRLVVNDGPRLLLSAPGRLFSWAGGFGVPSPLDEAQRLLAESDALAGNEQDAQVGRRYYRGSA
jgi:hypothetical protein